jgi:diadenosine tetraphosphate (Ap4A) HIT family hydrolase
LDGVQVPVRADSFCTGADFCHELSGATDTDFTRTYQGDPESRIICRSRNLSLLADLSPLTAGHLLLVSNDHYLSFGEVLNDHLDEVQEVLERIFGHYAEAFGDPVVFEHGSSRSMDGSACITHAHLHLLPLCLDEVHRTLMRDGLSDCRLAGIGDLRALGAQGLPYFYCGDRNTHRVYGVARKMRRQYLRSVAAELLGIADPEWDYALVVRKELLRLTMAKTIGWAMAST